jgi:hypothetical protein
VRHAVFFGDSTLPNQSSSSSLLLDAGTANTNVSSNVLEHTSFDVRLEWKLTITCFFFFIIIIITIIVVVVVVVIIIIILFALICRRHRSGRMRSTRRSCQAASGTPRTSAETLRAISRQAKRWMPAPFFFLFYFFYFIIIILDIWR